MDNDCSLVDNGCTRVPYTTCAVVEDRGTCVCHPGYKGDPRVACNGELEKHLLDYFGISKFAVEFPPIRELISFLQFTHPTVIENFHFVYTRMNE